MVQDVLKQKVPVMQVLELMLYCLPFVISQSAPFATLVGFLMCISRMVSDNEILVFRSLGNSFSFLQVPILMVGLIISVSSFYVNDYLVPLGASKYNSLYRKILLSNPTVELEPHSIKKTQDSVLVIGAVEGTNISDLLYFDTDSKGNHRIISSANANVLQSPSSSVLMQIDMQNAMTFLPDKDDIKNIDFVTSKSTFLNVFSSNFFSDSDFPVNPMELSTKDLRTSIDDMQKDGQTSNLYLNIFKVEYYRKFAVPFGSLFFAFLALPLSVMFGKNKGQTMGFILGISICLLYWAILTLGQVLGQKNGYNAFVLMFLPNTLVGILGLFFYIRMKKQWL